MNRERLLLLLQRKEGPGLEFKQEWYKLDDPNGETKKRQRGELVKDILSLANGNATTAGEDAYLIIGAADTRSEDGHRMLHDVRGPAPTPTRLLGMINRCCDPPLDDLLCETIEVDHKQLLVITVPASPHLHETLYKLDTAQATYTQHVVFVRHNEEITVASAKERDAIVHLKRVRAMERKNAPPVLFGLGIGAFIAAAILSGVADRLQVNPTEKAALSIAVILVGALLGAGFGWTYSNILRMRRDLQYIPARWRGLVLVGLIVAITGFVVVIDRIW